MPPPPSEHLLRPDMFSPENMKSRIEAMSPAEREAYKKECKAILDDANKVTSELSRFLNEQQVASADSQKHAGYLFTVQSTAIALTGLFVSAVMSVPEKFGYYSDQLKECKEMITAAVNGTIGTDELSRNLTEKLQTMDLLNITANGTETELDSTGLQDRLAEVCHAVGFKLTEFPALQNGLNIASYFAIAPALYQCFKNSAFAFADTVAMIPNMFRGQFPSIKELVSNGNAILSSYAYATIIFGVKAAIDYVTGVEEEFGFDTSMIPPGDYALWTAIFAIVMTLYGGAQAGTHALMTRAERRYLERMNIEPAPDDAGIELLTVRYPSKTQEIQVSQHPNIRFDEMV